MTRRWKMLDQAMNGDGPLDLPEAAYAELAARIHEAVSARSPGEMGDLAVQLGEAVDAARAKAPSAARAAADGSLQAGPPERAAYVLGQLGFAYQVLANALNRRADGAFEDRLTSGPLAACVELLAQAEMSGTEIADRLGSRPETVSRKLQELRAMGAVDFRREGTRLINFLTPAARCMLGGMQRQSRERRQIVEPVRMWVDGKTREQASFMRTVQSFALPEVVE